MTGRFDTSVVQVSVLVCTHNRPEMVSRAIRSLAESKLPQSQFEVLLIDSASTEPPHTAIEIGENSLANFRAIRVERPGLSLARNRGLEAAKGKIIVYIDDDAIAPPDWLPNILTSFEQADPRPSVVGGPVISEYETPLPAWWPPEYERMLSASPVQPSGFKTPDQFDGFAVNIAFDAEALRAVGGFSEKMGRIGDVLLGGEESLVIQNIFAAGGRLYFCGTAQVTHFVSSSRLNKKWLLKRLWAEGHTVVTLYRLSGKMPPLSKRVKEAFKLAGVAASIIPTPTRVGIAAAGRGSYAQGFFAALSNRAISQ